MARVPWTVLEVGSCWTLETGAKVSPDLIRPCLRHLVRILLAMSEMYD